MGQYDSNSATTANSISKIANGAADDLLTTFCWLLKLQYLLRLHESENVFASSTQSNLAKIRELGYFTIGPSDGSQAYGDEGPGRMTEPNEIIDHIAGHCSTEIVQNLEE